MQHRFVVQTAVRHSRPNLVPFAGPGSNRVSFYTTAEKESILHLKNGAKSALDERDLVGCWGVDQDLLSDDTE